MNELDVAMIIDCWHSKTSLEMLLAMVVHEGVQSAVFVLRI